ncbi:hypothetical protein [Methylorubrum thiocyanatum]|uniref:hypothetical protein n=1 Tax=Methylorubrum thiocyanatum TaxID=47958 RepID=UPI003F7D4EAB
MNDYKAQIAALLAQSDKSPLDTAIFLTRRSNEHRRDVWRVSRDEAVEEWIEKDRALFELQLDALYRAKASAPSGADLVKLIGDTLFDAIEENAACVYGTRITGHESMLGPKDVIGVDDGDLEMEPLARAVLSKLRAASLIEISGEEPATIAHKAVAEPVERQPLADLIPSIKPSHTPLYEAVGRKLGR